MSFIKRNLAAAICLLFLVALPLISFADTITCDPSKKICNPISTSTVQDFIKILLEGVLKIGIPIVALAVVYCGFLFVQARGNSEELTKAKDALLYTLIGAAILLGSWSIAIMITDTVTSLKP